jgi:hypothetical protein
MPSCAVCRQPITKPQRILLVESEVIHKKCAGGTTIGQRNAQALADARLEVARLSRHLEHAAALQTAEERRRQTAEDLYRTSQEAIRAYEAGAARRDGQLTAARNALASVTRELEELRKRTESAAPASEEQPMDDAEARFRLLELDPL